MRIAEYIDSSEHSGDELRRWFLDNREEVLDMLAEEEGRVGRVKRGRDTAVTERCVSTALELKSDLHSVHYAIVASFPDSPGTRIFIAWRAWYLSYVSMTSAK